MFYPHRVELRSYQFSQKTPKGRLRWWQNLPALVSAKDETSTEKYRLRSEETSQTYYSKVDTRIFFDVYVPRDAWEHAYTYTVLASGLYDNRDIIDILNPRVGFNPFNGINLQKYPIPKRKDNFIQSIVVYPKIVHMVKAIDQRFEQGNADILYSDAYWAEELTRRLDEQDALYPPGPKEDEITEPKDDGTRA